MIKKMVRTKHPMHTNAGSRQQMMNASFAGSGALGAGDRGGNQLVPAVSSNPYDSQDYVYRWRQYVHLYELSWEARKIVRIPIEDALRKPAIAEGIDEEIAADISFQLSKLGYNKLLSRSLMLERLLGGCLLFLGLESDDDDPSKKYNPSSGSALRFMNAVPLSRISRVTWDSNPLSEHYMRPSKFLINGEDVDISRFIVWDGDPLFDPYDFALTNFRANISGFGPSKLAPIWDDIMKAVGTRQAAYQMIQTNNAIIMLVDDLKSLQGTLPGQDAQNKLKEIANNLSLYRAAIIDGKSMDIKQQGASFGSVPELIITFIQILSAASDIPATRFLGQAPGGLNATGTSDLENYYNMLDALQVQSIEPAHRRIYDIIGYARHKARWKSEREKLTFKFPPLWNLSELEEADRTTKVLDNIIKSQDAGLLTDAHAIEEANAKGVFSVELDDTDEALVGDSGLGGGFGEEGLPTPGASQIDKLRNSIYVRNADNQSLLIKAAGVDPDTVDRKQFAKGFEVEMEHKDTVNGDKVVVAKIVLDHLDEYDDYYDRLEKVENAIKLDSLPTPTQAQIESGNYKKHHLRLFGLDMSIENPKGSTRRGVEPDGTPWETKLPAHYGYVKQTEGADGDHVDVYIGPDEKSELVFVVDQQDKDTGDFDEHKCIFGALSTTQAKELYLAGFGDGKGEARLRHITPMHISQFKQWLETGDTKAPFHGE